MDLVDVTTPVDGIRNEDMGGRGQRERRCVGFLLSSLLCEKCTHIKHLTVHLHSVHCSSQHSFSGQRMLTSSLSLCCPAAYRGGEIAHKQITIVHTLVQPITHYPLVLCYSLSTSQPVNGHSLFSIHQLTSPRCPIFSIC